MNSFYVPLAVRELQGSEIKVCAAIGFPLGATSFNVKLFEAEEALKNGARAIDMVINLGAFKSGDYHLIEEEIKGIVKVSGKSVITKIIIEACYLNRDEIINLSKMAMELGADFVKTSTGMGFRGATVEDVKLIRTVVGLKMGIKAAGGINSYNKSKRIIEAGADRIGTSQGVKIIREYLESVS